MKISKGFKMPETFNWIPREMSSIKLQRSLYGLKQSGRMWYNRFSEYLLKEGFINNHICSYAFIKKSKSGFAIIAVYVDDLNIIETPEELAETIEYFKKKFKMKDIKETKFYLDLQIENLQNGIFVIKQSIQKRSLTISTWKKSIY